MATSTLNFYQCEITPERNCIVDEISAYLNSLDKYTITGFQYIKLDLDITIKINLSQTNIPKFNYNYVSVLNSDLNKLYYYFIIGIPKWISSNTVQLELSMDTLNTFRNDLTWTNRTNITRQHKDRFSTGYTPTSSGTVYHRKIDDFDEGITPTKFYSTESVIRDSTYDYDFYLIYKNKEGLTASSTVPMDCYLCASELIPLSISTDAEGIYFDNYNKFDLICAFSKDNPPFTTTINGTSYTIGGSSEYKGIAFQKGATNIALLLRDNNSVLLPNIGPSALTDTNSTLKVRIINYQLVPTPESVYNYTKLLGIVESESYTVATIGTTTGNLNTINSVNRSDTRIVKIIKMPYAPFSLNVKNGKLNIPDGWTYSGGYLLLKDLNIEFLNIVESNDSISGLVNIVANTGDIGKNKPNNIKYESKLYNSNYFSLKYIYDNFEKEFLLERYSTNDINPGIAIRFKQSNNISSNSLFRLNATNGYYKEPTLYGEFLNVNRQNEVALYNSDYLNYIRTGYNYDKKAKNLQIRSQEFSAGISAVAGLAGLAFSGATGGVSAAAGISFLSSSVSSIANIINSSIAAEDNIKQKLEQYSKSPASVSNTEDLNLLSYYNGNRLIRYYEDINQPIKNNIYNLFRLTGYACSDYNIPVVDSRLYYNFIQCKADFDEVDWKYGKSILDDIKYKYEIGVVYFHRVDNSYDWLQEKENFESWMITN